MPNCRSSSERDLIRVPNILSSRRICTKHPILWCVSHLSHVHYTWFESEWVVAAAAVMSGTKGQYSCSDVRVSRHNVRLGATIVNAQGFAHEVRDITRRRLGVPVFGCGLHVACAGAIPLADLAEPEVHARCVHGMTVERLVHTQVDASTCGLAAGGALRFSFGPSSALLTISVSWCSHFSKRSLSSAM